MYNTQVAETGEAIECLEFEDEGAVPDDGVDLPHRPEYAPLDEGCNATVHEHFAQDRPDLDDPSKSEHSFVRVADNLWMHITFIESFIHSKVRLWAVWCGTNPTFVHF